MKASENIIISDPERFHRKIEAIRREGSGKLHVLADFDRTLTYNSVDGQKHASLIAILRTENYLTPDYPEKARALRNKYMPIEFDLSIPLAERKKAMDEWWTKMFELLRESKLNIYDLEKVVSSGKIQLRRGVEDFMDYLHNFQVPLVIMSASGIGEEVIEIFLNKRGLFFDNVFIVANSFEWDESGFMKKAREPFIHSYNKDETAIHEFPAYEKIKSRKNILLLGDHPGDAGMSEGFDVGNIIKIGFLNERVKENLDHYKEIFDVVFLNDPPFEFPLELIKEII
jgi:HAD superfamily hydrolase (TIGR01544 family)